MLTTEGLRIALVGSGGTGKTELGQALSDELNLPFLKSRLITRQILDADGYVYGGGVQVETFLFQGDRQERLSTQTMELEKQHNSFVADRSVLDLSAYAVAELCKDKSNDELDKLMKRYDVHMNKYRYTDVFVCPWRDKIKDNGLRTLNKYYQLMIHRMCLGVLEDSQVLYHILKSEKLEERVKEVVEAIEERQRIG